MVDAHDLLPNPNLAWKVVQWLNPSQPVHVERMNSSGANGPTAKNYGQKDSGNFKKFLATNNDQIFRRNIYFLPNAEFLVGKRNKANISAARFLHADLDAKDYPGTEKEQFGRIIDLLFDPKVRPKGVPQPSFTWFTGGGLQTLLWPYYYYSCASNPLVLRLILAGTR